MKSESVACKGYLVYQDKSLESSLYRNGKVTLGRFVDGRSGKYNGVSEVTRQVSVFDARKSAVPPSLDKNGFTLVDDSLSAIPDFFDSHVVVKDYYTHCEQLAKKHMGATHAYAFDHNVRTSCSKSAQNQTLKNTQQKIQTSIGIVHADYTLTSAYERIQQLTQPPKKNDTHSQEKPLIPVEVLKKATRYGIVNVWRSIKQGENIKRNPLVCADASSVEEKDLVTLEIHYEDRIGENYFLKHNDNHKWYMYPEMNIHEAILLKTWDSKGVFANRDSKGDIDESHSTFSAHSGLGNFVGVDMQTLPDRWSIEVRVVVLFSD